ncbi:DUF4199 domain-containing protein [Fulvivirga maritima]|uniref:DUF4199 domain-containing protein n=1 Tax=Fulvivirga maritima TaxID=2904247 RepID=UPI001F2607AE|nr:DUF4199 domain-containing protein [Fulvivirga maritima]UII24506.1 DUF4199 domain-containing protein [Fulvivirga maritima]
MKPIVKVPLKFGLFGALLGMVVILVLYFINRHPLLIPPHLDFRILLFAVFIFFALKEFKDYYNNQMLNFWQGMIIGFIVYLVIGLLVGLGLVILCQVVPHFLTTYIEGTINGMMLNKEQLIHGEEITITEAQFNEQIEEMRNATSAVVFFDYLGKSLFIGFPITIIISIIMRRTENRFSK